ncbi:hypothetical protein LZ31DRAFT_560496 [Colletotrichum somersetense]|nr:hypothetical protein LZ31DRAFT_560496 [Colletotrichum somersetense]
MRTISPFPGTKRLLLVRRNPAAASQPFSPSFQLIFLPLFFPQFSRQPCLSLGLDDSLSVFSDIVFSDGYALSFARSKIPSS